MKYFGLNRTNERGDTIVEVLIAMAIISLVLVGAYVTSTHNAASLQNSQEREQAQRLVESQIEMLRANGGIVTPGDCFNNSVETSTCDTFTASNSGATYKLTVDGPSGVTNPVGVYTVTATWTSIGSNANDDSSVTMYYRLN